MSFNNLEGLYSFIYDPKGKGILKVYDRRPLIFILAKVGGIILGLNLHWIARNERTRFVDSVIEIMNQTEKGKGGKSKRLRLVYSMLKQPKFRSGLNAIRKYYVSRCSSITEIPKKKWTLILKLDKYDSDKRMKVNDYKKG